MDPTSIGLALAAGGLAGYVLSQDGRRIEFLGLNKLLETIRDSKPEFLKEIYIDTSSYRDKQEFPYQGDFLYIFNPGDPSTTVSIHLNEPESPAIPLTEMRGFKGPFYRFFISNYPGSGVLHIMIGKGYQLDLMPSAPASQISSNQLPEDLSIGDNLKVCVAEIYGNAYQKIYNYGVIQNGYKLQLSGGLSTGVDYWCPDTSYKIVSDKESVTCWIWIPVTGGMTISKCEVWVKPAAFMTARKLTGAEILHANFVQGEWNAIHLEEIFYSCKLLVSFSGAAPTGMDMVVVGRT